MLNSVSRQLQRQMLIVAMLTQCVAHARLCCWLLWGCCLDAAAWFVRWGVQRMRVFGFGRPKIQQQRIFNGFTNMLWRQKTCVFFGDDKITAVTISTVQMACHTMTFSLDLTFDFSKQFECIWKVSKPHFLRHADNTHCSCVLFPSCLQRGFGFLHLRGSAKQMMCTLRKKLWQCPPVCLTTNWTIGQNLINSFPQAVFKFAKMTWQLLNEVKVLVCTCCRQVSCFSDTCSNVTIDNWMFECKAKQVTRQVSN